jgi:hypothetical protein
MCLLVDNLPLYQGIDEKFDSFISQFDKHGYIPVYKIDKRNGIGKWNVNGHRWSSGLVHAKKNEVCMEGDFGFHGFLTIEDLKKEGTKLNYVKCMVKKSWIIGVETNSRTNFGRALRCTSMVFPEEGKDSVSVREFRTIIKE